MQQLDVYYYLLSQHVSGIIMHVETEVNNKHLILASCWFFSLRTVFKNTFQPYIRSQEPKFLNKISPNFSVQIVKRIQSKY